MSCCGGQIAIPERAPVARHCATRASVHTTALGRGRTGSSTLRAGLSVISPSRTAAFNAARSVVRMWCSVDGVCNCPNRFVVAPMVANAVASYRVVSSPNRICPSCGIRNCSTCP